MKKPYDDMSLPFYRNKSVKAAKQLGYPNSTIEKIKNAKSQHEITRLMTTARQASSDKQL